MPRVIFKFDKEKDLFNIWETCNKNPSYGFDFKKNMNPKTVSICENRKFEDCRNELAKRFEKIHSSKLISIYLKALNDSWRTINNEFFKRLEKIMKKPIYNNLFTGYLTFSNRCPYILKENAFYFGFFNSICDTLRLAGHEIMHLQFHNAYWNEIEKQIGNEKTHDLKEALTVLLNLEFKDLWMAEDKGYESHNALREFIASEWKKEKDFEVLLRKCMEYLK